MPGLDPAKRDKVERTLDAAYHDYLSLEAKHMQRTSDAKGRQVVAIGPFPDELDELENRMWTQLDQILDPVEQRAARSKWPLRAYFPFGRDKVTVVIWRQGSWYNWQETNQAPGHGSSLPTYLEHIYKQ